MLALLSGASPRTCKEGPVVRLLAGKWSIRVQGVVDSILTLYAYGHPTREEIVNGFELLLEIPTSVQIEFKNRGKEDYITAFAERV